MQVHQVHQVRALPARGLHCGVLQHCLQPIWATRPLARPRICHAARHVKLEAPSQSVSAQVYCTNYGMAVSPVVYPHRASGGRVHTAPSIRRLRLLLSGPPQPKPQPNTRCPRLDDSLPPSINHEKQFPFTRRPTSASTLTSRDAHTKHHSSSPLPATHRLPVPTPPLFVHRQILTLEL